MQRLAATQAGQTTTRLVQLPNDEMKGRIIGRDGRNIRALENLTGVDFIIDETPSAVVLSSFDGVRREVARLTLEKLIADGRIHPARCEEAYEQASAEIDDRIVEEAERALLEARVTGVHPELVRLLGRLKFRTSYGQNVLDHLVEVLAPGGADGGRARRLRRRWRGEARCCMTSARPSATRSTAPTRSSAPGWPAATTSPRRSPTRSRPTTTRSSRERSRR